MTFHIAESIGTGSALVLGEATLLVSWWKPLILLAPFVPWAWLVSTVYDKHAMRFHLKRKVWNLAQMLIGVSAAVLGFGVPAMVGLGGIGGFLVSLAIILLLLGAGVVAYPMVANKDERVPESHRIRLDFSEWAEARKRRAAAKQAGTAELVITGPDKTLLTVPNKDDPEFEVRLQAEKLAMEARDRRATQVDLLPTGKDSTYAVSFLVDGLRQQGEAMSAQDANRIIDVWKRAGRLDLQDRRRKQTADVRIARGQDSFIARLTTLGGQGGVRLSMLFDPAKQVRRKPADLGLLERQMAELEAIVQDAQGVVLLSAPPDHGRTTMLYTVLKMHDAYTSNVQTIELEIQDALEGARQNPFNPAAEDAELATLVRSVLRRDPQVVGVAETDAATLQQVARADHERTRTYVSLKADGGLAAVQKWVQGVGDLEQAGSCLHGVVAGKLVRRLCEQCKVAYQPSQEMLRKLGLPTDKVNQLFKKGGQVLVKDKPQVCPVCNGAGYLGQTGAFEVYRIGPEERELVQQGNLQGLRAQLRQKQLPSLQQAALRKAVEGVTSVEEVARITSNQPADGKKASSAAPQAAPTGG